MRRGNGLERGIASVADAFGLLFDWLSDDAQQAAERDDDDAHDDDDKTDPGVDVIDVDGEELD